VDPVQEYQMRTGKNEGSMTKDEMLQAVDELPRKWVERFQDLRKDHSIQGAYQMLMKDVPSLPHPMSKVKRNPRYGFKTYPKIDIYIDGKYVYSTNAYPSVKSAKEAAVRGGEYASVGGMKKIPSGRVVARRANPCGSRRKNLQDPLGMYGGRIGMKGYDPSMYERGYADAAVRFGYIPDFKNDREKKSWEAGYKAGIAVREKKAGKKNPVYRFKKEIDAGDLDCRFEVLEDRGDRVLVQEIAVSQGPVYPTYIYPKSSLVRIPKKKNPGGKTNPRRHTTAKGRWYVLYSPTGSKYHALEKKVHGGWKWTERLADAKAYGSYAGAKREYEIMRNGMSTKAGSVLMVAIEEEARSFLL